MYVLEGCYSIYFVLNESRKCMIVHCDFISQIAMREVMVNVNLSATSGKQYNSP